MHSFWKSLVLVVVVFCAPVLFTGCGPSQVSDEEAAKTAAPEEDPAEDADEDESGDGGESEDGDSDGE
ncbi:MAG: hypothetical protein H8E66_14550 [Planctomycetes bacterium]|nr:hypothetical protein [Planctomycetota bacterium]